MPILIRPTITETFLERVKLAPDRVAFHHKQLNEWKSVTFRQFHDSVRLLSYGLMSLGIGKGDKVALLSSTRLDWTLADMAILGAGAVTVPIYPSNTPEDVRYILSHSESKAVVVEDSAQLRKILDLKEAAGVERIIVIEPAAMSAGARDAKNILTLQALEELGKREEGNDPARFERNLREAKPDDLITICYTSGTTGVPKGVLLTHDNLMSALEDATQLLEGAIEPEDQLILSFLPFSHILGKYESLSIHVFGWQEAFAESFDKLPANFQEIRPTLVFAVPRIFEKAFTKITSELAHKPAATQGLFHWAITAGKATFEARWEKKRPRLLDLAQYELADQLIFRQIRAGFGGRLRYAVCGGAPLPKQIGEFFDIVGIRILEGYGLTETCAPIAVNSPHHPRFGTVGKPMPEVAIRIAEDGEILVKSRKVFKGYHRMPEETAAVFKDGWFQTGDIGLIDEEGMLRITDRKKDLIVTSAGKNVAPQKIENLAKSQKLLNQVVVHGDRRNYLTALVTLNRQLIIQYASENQVLFSEYSELVKHPKVVTLVQNAIDAINSQLASFETIKKFIILPAEFTVEGGELTPSLKIRRRVIEQRYRALLDSMYA